MRQDSGRYGGMSLDVGSSDLPEDVRTLITRHVASVLDLDVLLAMRMTDRAVTCEELARELRLNETACEAALDKFARAGFLTASGPAYSYRPKSAMIGSSVDSLADAYAVRRVSVIRFIYRRPSDGVSAFADAFRLRKDDE
jgi:DNA-binding Lrp family transcriptional regulator